MYICVDFSAARRTEGFLKRLIRLMKEIRYLLVRKFFLSLSPFLMRLREIVNYLESDILVEQLVEMEADQSAHSHRVISEVREHFFTTGLRR